MKEIGIKGGEFVALNTDAQDLLYSNADHKILIGKDSPFANFCSFIYGKINLDKRDGFIGLLGPMRMDYNKNLSLIDFSRRLIK